MNCGFEQLIYVMPDKLVSIDSLVREAGFDDEMITRLHNGGLNRVPVGDGKPLPFLVRRAVSSIASVVSDLSDRTRGIVFAHSVPLLSPADVSFLEMCLEGSNLESIPRIAVDGQPCAILHFAVQLASYWLQEVPSDCGILLLGADQVYSTRDRIFFGSVMGDVAVAGFITRKPVHNRILASVCECEIIVCEGEQSPQEDIARFRQLNPLYIRHAIETCLRQGHVDLTDIKLIIPHTPYTMIWDTVAELLSFPRNRILTDYISETGHMNSNDSFAHYIRAVKDKRIHDGDVVLLINPAFGGTRGCTIIRR